MLVKGTVVSIRDFGAFLDIGGVQALLPISEIGWDRVEDIHERLSAGQVLDVLITRIDLPKNRISLSLKQTLADPWNDVDAKYPEGTVHKGKIVRLTKFGAFVTLGPGIDGLLHISKLGKGKRIVHPSDAVKLGDLIEVKVDSIDKEKKRISLSLADGGTRGEEEGGAEAKTSDDYRSYIGKTPPTLGSLGDIMKKNAKQDVGKGEK